MRIIIISDVHANIVALESVMTKVKVHRPDIVVCLGDLVGYGPHPNEVIEYIRSSGIVCTLGGADERLAYDFARDKRPRVGVADKTLEWTRTVIEEHNLNYLRNLPVQARVSTPYGRLRFFHASMDTTQSTVKLGNDPIAEKYFQAHRAKIIAYGKTHVPQIRQSPFGVVVNPGSVGLSLNGEPGADYAVLDIDETSVKVEMDKVEYDFAAVAFEIAAWELPSVVGEAVRQGKMPMEDTKMQRDPSKVRIQTKIVVGRQGRTEEPKEQKAVQDLSAVSSSVQGIEQGNQQRQPLGVPLEAQTLPDQEQMLESTESILESVDSDLSPVVSVDEDLPSRISSEEPYALLDETFHEHDAEQLSEGAADDTYVAETVHVEGAYEGFDIDDPLESQDIPLAYDDGMLNLDILDDSAQAMITKSSDGLEDVKNLARSSAEERLLSEVAEEEQRELRSGQEVTDSQLGIEENVPSVEAVIDAQVEGVMLELKRQLQQAVAQTDTQSMTPEQLKAFQEKALDIESIKAMVLQNALAQQPANTSTPKTQATQTEATQQQQESSPQTSSPQKSGDESFLPQGFLDD